MPGTKMVRIADPGLPRDSGYRRFEEYFATESDFSVLMPDRKNLSFSSLLLSFIWLPKSDCCLFPTVVLRLEYIHRRN